MPGQFVLQLNAFLQHGAKFIQGAVCGHRVSILHLEVLFGVVLKDNLNVLQVVDLIVVPLGLSI